MASVARRLLRPIIPTEDSRTVFISQVREVADSHFTTLSDSELIEHLRNGSRQALGSLFLRYRRLVLTVSLRILRDNSEAEDVVRMFFWRFARRRRLLIPVAVA